MKIGKKRICLVCEFPPPPGGMSNQALMLEHYLKKNNFIVRRCKVNIRFPPLLQYMDNFIVAKILFKFPIIIFRLLINIVKSDIVHIFFIGGLYFYVNVIPAVIISKLLRKRIIVNYHAGFFSNFYNNSFKPLVRIILGMSDYVTTPLFHLESEFLEAGVHIIQVPNVIDLKDFEFKQRDVFKPKFIASRHLRTVYGLDIVIKAFQLIHKKYHHATLTIAGDGDKREDLESLARELGVHDCIVFTGYIGKDELLTHYDNGDIFLNGSRRDNMPISILESFALGLAVVSTNPMGIPFLVSDGVTGLLSEIDDFEGLARNAIKILETPRLGNDLTINAKHYIESLTWPHVYPKLARVYFE